MSADDGIQLNLSGGPEVDAEIVHFRSDGLRLRGVLVTPRERAGAVPALVASHGWSGAVNFRVLPLAGRLAQRGYAVLAIDHRGFGDSEGVRLRCDPAEQVRDVSAAATYLAGRPEIDGSALGVMGASFGGAIAVAAAAADERLKACLSLVPLADGRRWLEELHGADLPALLARLDRDDAERARNGSGGDGAKGARTGSGGDGAEGARTGPGEGGAEGARTGVGERVPLSVLMPLPPSPALDAEAAFIQSVYPEGYPLENVRLALDFSPESLAPAIAPRALCLITPVDDTVISADHSRAVYARAGEPKELHLPPEGGHGGPMGPLTDTTAEIAGAFLDKHLRPSGGAS
ncbi:alpha/beta fold hydrolase [Streptosporangium sp. NPDC000563]|uniref:alpha/beta hydrolase n=1 Tax=unclassified Streptosporangium TaxID=2632669 RepID=UPI0033344C7B